MKKRLLALTLMLVMVLSLAACGSTPAPSNAPSAPADNQPAASGSGTDNQPAAGAAKDTLIVSGISNGENFDPNNTEEFDRMVVNSVYDTLFMYDNDGEPIPGLAESWEDDGQVITVKLREGINFHDGTPFNADAVLKNYQYHLEGDGGYSMELYASDISKVDEYTIAVTKTTPYSSFVDYCCSYFYMVSPTAYEADPAGMATHPVGTGAYVFTSRDPATGYVYLTANPDYFLGKPGFEHVEVHTQLDSATALIALQNGELDIFCRPTVADAQIAAADASLVVDSAPGWNLNTAAFYGEPYISDINLRMAIYYAINRENAALYNGLEGVEISKDLFSVGIMGDYTGILELDGYDPELAAQYLAQSNYNGETLEINITSNFANIAASVQYDLQAIGINAEINTLDGATWVSKIFDGTCGITFATLGGSYGTLEEMLQTFYSYDGYYGSLGIMAMDDAVASAVDEAIAITDTAERIAAVRDAYEQCVNMYNFVPMYEETFSVIYSSSITGPCAKWAASECAYLYQVQPAA